MLSPLKRRDQLAKKYYLYEVHVNGKKTGTYTTQFMADKMASEAMFGTTDKVETRKTPRLPGPSFDDEGYTIVIDKNGYGRKVK